jgi:hypothetical protein
MSDAVTAAQAQADQAWGEHGAVRGPMRDELLASLKSLEGVTGLQAGPGAERLVDAFLDFAEFHADEINEARTARQQALAAQDERDKAYAEAPPAPAEPTPTMLETAEPLEVREWLKSANDVDVLEMLSNVPDRDQQVEWARTLLAWGRQDGNVAGVFAAINSVLVGENPADIADGGTTGGVGGTSSYRGSKQIPESASAGDEPTAREHASDSPPVDGDADAMVAWINHGADDTADLGRARQAFAVESGRDDGGRPDVLAAIVDMIDAAKPAAAPAAESEGTPEPE